jgi:hypothetical protein
MKNLQTLSFGLFLLIFPAILSAQKSLKERLAQEFCEELNKQEVPEVLDEAAMQQLGLAMVPTITKHLEEIKKEFGLDMDSQQSFEEIGRIIGAEAGISCPKFKKMMDEMMRPKIEETMNTVSFDGSFQSLDTSGSFAFFKVKDDSGREQKIWWLEYFAGSELLKKDAKSLKDKRIKVSYIEREVYEPRLQEYIKVKIAVNVLFLN